MRSPAIAAPERTSRLFTQMLYALAALAIAMIAAVVTTGSAAAEELRIGYQKSSTLMAVLKANGELEKALAPLGITISWHEFSSGLPLLEAINIGSIDLGADVADTVPIFAQAAGAKLAYVAEEAASPAAQAILVPTASAIQTLADLKGKRIAVTKGAGSHYLLLAAPGEGRPHLQGHHASLSAAGRWPRRLRQQQCRCLGRLGPVPEQRAQAIGRASPRRRLGRACQLQALLPRLRRLCRSPRRCAQRDLRQAGRDRKMGEGQPGGGGAPARRPLGDRCRDDRGGQQPSLLPGRRRDPAGLSEQQRIADAFLAEHVLPAKLDTSALAIWTPKAP